MSVKKWSEIGTAAKAWIGFIILAVPALITAIFWVVATTGDIKRAWGQEAEDRAEVVVKQQMAPIASSVREIEAGQKFDRCLKIGPREIERPENWADLDDLDRETWCDEEQDAVEKRWAWEDCEVAAKEVNMNANEMLKMCRARHGPDPREP